VKTSIHLACSECKRRNYSTSKSKQKAKERIEVKKYCAFCKKRTLHRETK